MYRLFGNLRQIQNEANETFIRQSTEAAPDAAKGDIIDLCRIRIVAGTAAGNKKSYSHFVRK